MADKKKFPNPEFFRAKTEMDWKAQAANLKEFGSIALDLIKETDWKAFGRKQKEHFLDNMNRVAREAKAVAAMTCAERKDLLLNGEKHLGALYRKGDMATVRREWRGVESTLVDFSGWLKVWGMLLATFSKDLIPALNTTFWYRWMISYMCCVSFMDKNTMGQRGNALKMSHLMTYDIFRYVAENLVFLAKCDKKNGNSSELNKKVVLFDEMTMGQIMAGFPDLLGIPYQLMPVFLVSEIDQLTCVPYIDAVESFGLPADCCPVPSSECGALVIDALPHMGKCFISSSMPCDGSTMASSYMSRRFPDLPVFHLCFPVRYEDEETVQMGAEDIRACIKFIEEQTGAKWSWDAYFSAMKRFNEETRYELEKWEVNKTAYPQIIGPSYELFRKWNYEMDGGIDPRVYLGRSVKVGDRGISGVIGLKPIHMLSKEEELDMPKGDEMYIDIGAESADEAREYVSLGDTVVFDSGIRQFGDGFVQGRALDDRMGCAVMIELIKSELEYDADFSFSVQEEIGTRGAQTAAFSVRPDYAIVLETTTAADIPGVEGEKRVCALGEGAVVGFMDRGTIYDSALYELAFKKAEENGIKIQTKTMVAGGNDARTIHVSAGGVRTLAISLPCRYLHSPSCVIKLSDGDEVFRLARVMLEELADA
mgnify:CR=1 FL=1